MKLLSLLGMLTLPALAQAVMPGMELGNRPVIVVAESGHYDGRQVHLYGDVSLDHELGVVKAQEAILSRTLGDDDHQFSLLKLRGRIQMLLHTGGSFHCSRAELDFRTLTGRFYGDDGQQYVTYSDTFESKIGEEAVVVLRGRHMSVVMSQLAMGGDESLFHQVQQIVADHNVTVDYNHEFTALGDHMVYQRYQQGEDADDTAPMPGMISLRPNEFYGTCQVSSHEGDLIKAQEIELDLPQQTVAFDEPRGAIYFIGADAKRRRLDFSSRSLTWNHRTNLLELHNDVVLYQGELGKITCSDTLQVCQTPGGGLQELQWIRSNGVTEITYETPQREEVHFLSCQGEVFIDTESKVTTLQSLRQNGVVPRELQVYFRDSRGSVFADTARLDYDWMGKGISPRKLTVEGNVRIMNRSMNGEPVQGKPLQYALADVVEYLPEQEQMALYAQEEGRVLFYDRLNKVQVSAPAVNVRRDGTTGKEAIEGIGDVRFSFAEHERSALIETFGIEEAYQ